MSDGDELTKLRFQYAWNHFELHAKQRTTMFNFFLIIIAIFGNGVVLVLNASSTPYPAAILAVASAGICAAFFVLDVRNVQLLKMSEKVLAKLERDYIYKDFGFVDVKSLGNIPLGMLWRENEQRQRYDALKNTKENTLTVAEKSEKKTLWPLRSKFFSHKSWIRGIQIVIGALFVAFAATTWIMYVKSPETYCAAFPNESCHGTQNAGARPIYRAEYY